MSPGSEVGEQSRKTLAVLSCTAQAISFFDVETGTCTGRLDGLVAEPHELLYDERNDLLYATHTYRSGMYGAHGEFSKEISVIDGNRKVVDIIDVSPSRGPHDLALDKKNNLLWVSVEELAKDCDGGLVAIDLDTREIVKEVSCEAALHWFKITPDGRKAYTANKQYPFISILDLEAERMIGKIMMPDGCEEPGIANDGSRVYFPTPGLRFGNTPMATSVQVVDTNLDQIVTAIPLDPGYGTECVHVTSQGTIMIGQYRFGPRQSSGKPTILPGRLLVFDSSGSELLGKVELGKMPLTMRATPDGKLGFVANCQEGSVSIIDLESLSVRRVLDVDGVACAANKFLSTSHGLALIP